MLNYASVLEVYNGNYLRLTGSEIFGEQWHPLDPNLPNHESAEVNGEWPLLPAEASGIWVEI